jgi:transcriptional regulator GlxA family with amidase domain
LSSKLHKSSITRGYFEKDLFPDRRANRDYLAKVRLEAAQQLLADSALPITEIARRTGFSSPTLFGRIFKRHIGQTPQAYRQEVLAQTRFRPSILM